LALLDLPAVAMVGARNASAAGIRFARGLAQALGEAGLLVVSGLARGIDTAAHQGAIETGTVGVIAGGIDIVYPPENEALQLAIAERGLLVAEQPPGIEPRARHFPSRNRIIAALAAGTVVVEAAPKSGSLITARLAAEYGREVMAVPGSPLDPRAQGCNLLIREGATLIQSADDVLELIRPIGPAWSPSRRATIRPNSRRRRTQIAMPSRTCSAQRPCSSTKWCASPAVRLPRYRWCCSNSNSPAGWSVMQGGGCRYPDDFLKRALTPLRSTLHPRAYVRGSKAAS
jgi:DNA protecting protein DprA